MELSDQELKIAQLREKEKWTFRAIGALFGFSDRRAAQIYYRLQRKRRYAKRLLLSLPENQIRLSFSLTRGEALILDKILSAVLDGQLDHSLQIESHDLDPDYLTAMALAQRLVELL